MKYIIGINEGQNSSLVLYDFTSKEIVFAAQEERFNKIKEYIGFPELTLNYVVQKYRLSNENIIYICLSDLIPPNFSNKDFLKTYEFYSTSILQDFLNLKLSNAFTKIYKANSISKLKKYFSFLKYFKFKKNKINIGYSYILNKFNLDNSKIIRTKHHLNHAATAYFGCAQNENDEHLVFTLDGGGDGDCSNIYIAKKNKMSLIAETSAGNSVGNIYSRVTFLLGMQPHSHEYKLMGMAPYANPNYIEDVCEKFFSYLDLNENNPLEFKRKISEETYKILPRLLKDFKMCRFDNICGGLQLYTERLIVKWIKKTIEKTKIKKIVCAGGVFMNIKVNKIIAEIPELEYFDVFPSCGDETLNFGALWLQIKNEAQTETIDTKFKNIYLGPESGFDEKYIDQNFKSKIHYKKYDDIEFETAKLLAEHKIVARCSGRMEFGARALGNRSILGNPSDFKIVSRINKMVKKRDFWMPFSPMMTKEAAHKYIIIPKSINNESISPFMMHSFDTKLEATHLFPAAIHPYDNTARAQIVSEDTNKNLMKILKYYGDITGQQVLLNTSFNLHGYPIVLDYKDAIEVFIKSDLTHLVIDKYLLTKA
jgi:carbamoyltransferase